MSSKRSSIRVNETEISVVETGGTPTLLFLHYWGGSTRTWQPVIDRLSDTFHCIAVDFRGWGRSSRQAFDYDLETLANDVSGVISALNLSDFIIVGHSMGGKVAQLIAARKPEGLRQLILVAPAPPTGLEVSEEQRREMLASYQTREGVAQAIGILTERPLSEACREQVAEDTLGGAPDAKRAWIEKGMIQDISEETAKVTVPVHVIVGSADRVEPEPSLRTAFGKVIPAAEFTILPGVGHLSPLEATAELADAIRAARQVA